MRIVALLGSFAVSTMEQIYHKTGELEQKTITKRKKARKPAARADLSYIILSYSA